MRKIKRLLRVSGGDNIAMDRQSVTQHLAIFCQRRGELLSTRDDGVTLAALSSVCRAFVGRERQL
jgi:uncharacterized protein with PIN domain